MSSVDGKVKNFTRFYWLAAGQGVLLRLPDSAGLS